MDVVIDNKRTGVKATNIEEYFPEAPLGACIWYPKLNKLSFACPGCGLFGGVRIGHPKPKQTPSWDITKGSPEDVTTLTIRPSINCVGCCGWHGFLNQGVFELEARD